MTEFTKDLIFSLCLLFSWQLSAQDRILTLKQDTLKAKVSSIDKQKITFYPETDKEKKLFELPLTDLHKIIWRNSHEYIINQRFEDSLKKLKSLKIETPVVSGMPVNGEKPRLSEEKNNQLQTKTPELKVRRWIVWRAYKIDGKRVSKYTMERTIAKYDSEALQEFKKGNDTWERGAKILGLSAIPFAVRFATKTIDVKSPLALVITIGLDVVALGHFFVGNKMMYQAVMDYEGKRIANRLKLK
jgi:hypothetical protein